MLRPPSHSERRERPAPSQRVGRFSDVSTAIRMILISVKAFGLYQKRKRVEVKIRCQVVSEQAQRPILRLISERFTRLRAFVFEPEHVLEMMNHFMDQDRQLARSAPCPVVGQIYRLSSVVVNGDSVVLSKPRPVVFCRLLDGKERAIAQGGNFTGRHEFYARLAVNSGKVKLN